MVVNKKMNRTETRSIMWYLRSMAATRAAIHGSLLEEGIFSGTPRLVSLFE